MKVDLKDKVVVVTGAAGGIGKSCAKVMLENGAKVIIADITDEQGQRSAEELSSYGSCEFIYMDVTSEKSIEELIDKVVGEFGRIDIFVNNAGINVASDRRANIDSFPRDIWESILAVDLTGVFNCSKAVSKLMIKQQYGRIINIGSVFGNVPARKQIAFVAAKGGMHNMTKAMAMELAPFGITVNCVAPGSTVTEGTKKLFYGEDDPVQADLAKRMISHIPLGRPGDVEDVAYAVLFLASNESKYITGHILTVDGGWTCGYTRDF